MASIIYNGALDDVGQDICYTSAIHNLLNPDTVLTVSIKKEQDLSAESSTSQSPEEQTQSSPETSTSSLPVRRKRKSSKVQRYGNVDYWENVTDMEEDESNALVKRKSVESDYEEDNEKHIKKRGRPSSSSQVLPAVTVALAYEEAPKVPSYDSLFDLDDPLSDPDAEVNLQVSNPAMDLQMTAPQQNSMSSRGRMTVRTKKTVIRPSNKISKEALAASMPGKPIFKKIDDQDYLVQWRQCQNIKQVTVQLCRHCTKRQGGDTCRFLNIRAFPVRVSDRTIEFLDMSKHGAIFVDDLVSKEEAMLPDHFDLNRPMDHCIKDGIKSTAAVSLIDTLKAGLQHAQQGQCILRARELQIRAMCDYCSTGLFVASYLCRRCGQEYCTECKENLEHLTKQDYGSNHLCQCVRDKFIVGLKAQHFSTDLIPVSRFAVSELENEIKEMQMSIIPPPSEIKLEEVIQPHNVIERQDDTIEEKFKADDNKVLPPSQAVAIHRKTDMTEEIFLATWRKGHPLVVTETFTPHRWDPQAFIDRYGEMDCEIVRSDDYHPFMTYEQIRAKEKTNPNYFKKWIKAVKVRDYFNTFGKPLEERTELFGKGIWKLKDWPPSTEFSTFFPEIYQDFNHAVPMPDYTRRDGCWNISALFPKNANGPDLGPKMYNAWPGEHSKGKKGTTCLHMDVADAVNMMLFAADTGEAPAAQWDIFRAEDADAIREFLQERYPQNKVQGDPIHTQTYFLDDEELAELYQKKKVYSWRILQEVGQAVFIPAGCAHQVCNLTDCIKVAVDFISPQNVKRCFKLTEEFRGMNFEGKRSWKEDVLQLRAQLWYAWLACRAMPEAPERKEHEKRIAIRAMRAKKRLEEEVELSAKTAHRRKGATVKEPVREIYKPRPTASGRGAKAIQHVKEEEVDTQMGKEMELETIGSERKKRHSVKKAAKKNEDKKGDKEKAINQVTENDAHTSTAPLMHFSRISDESYSQQDTPTSSIDVSYVQSLHGRKLEKLLLPLELKWNLKAGSLMQNCTFPAFIKGSKCVECKCKITKDWRCGPTGPKTLCISCGRRWSNEIKKAGGNPRAVALVALAKRELGGAEASGEGNHLEIVGSRTSPAPEITGQVSAMCKSDEIETALECKNVDDAVKAVEEEGQSDIKKQGTENIAEDAADAAKDVPLYTNASNDSSLTLEGNYPEEECTAAAENIAATVVQEIVTYSDACTDTGQDLMNHIKYKERADASTNTDQELQVPQDEYDRPVSDDILIGVKGDETEDESNFQAYNMDDSFESISSGINRLPLDLSDEDRKKCRTFAERLYRAAGVSIEGAEIETPPPRGEITFRRTASPQLPSTRSLSYIM